jgi:hypothetical protein
MFPELSAVTAPLVQYPLPLPNTPIKYAGGGGAGHTNAKLPFVLKPEKVNAIFCSFYF